MIWKDPLEELAAKMNEQGKNDLCDWRRTVIAALVIVALVAFGVYREGVIWGWW